MTTLSRTELTTLCRHAVCQAGAADSDAQVLAEATVEAELVGNTAVGVAHLFDYLDGYRRGRIDPHARPRARRAGAAVIDVDADRGLAQTAFTSVFDDLRRAIADHGIAAAWIRNSFTCGELGFYPRRLAQHGFVAVAVANSPALMSVGGAPTSVLGTNPLAYGIPRPGQLPLVIDQASSSTAFVNIRRAAEHDEPIPAGWALDADGHPTLDPAAALEGTLLPFGSHRGGNIALLVEILATLSGATFSLEAAPFDQGGSSPGIGVFVLGIDPGIFTGSVDRLLHQLTVLREEHQVRLPAMKITTLPSRVDVPEGLLRQLRAAATAPT